MILDTAFLIALYEENQAAFAKATQVSESGAVPRVPTPVLQELEYGAEYVGDAHTRRQVRNVTRMYPQVDLTVFDHQRAGQLHAQADKAASGGSAGLDQIDPMVAAVADRYGEPVLTENVDDFRKLGVDVETW